MPDPDPPVPHRRRLRRYDGLAHARFLTWSCFQRRRFLESDRTRTWLLDAIELARETHRFALWAFVIMPEHVHLLIFPHHERPAIGPVLSTIKQSVAKKAVAWVRENSPSYLPRMADQSPSGRTVYRFWQRGAGYDRNLWSPRHVWNAIDYIHRNPVERGLCASAADWRWSSASEMCRAGAGPLRLDLERLPPRPA